MTPLGIRENLHPPGRQNSLIRSLNLNLEEDRWGRQFAAWPPIVEDIEKTGVYFIHIGPGIEGIWTGNAERFALRERTPEHRAR